MIRKAKQAQRGFRKDALLPKAATAFSDIYAGPLLRGFEWVAEVEKFELQWLTAQSAVAVATCCELATEMAMAPLAVMPHASHASHQMVDAMDLVLGIDEEQEEESAVAEAVTAATV
jgi:hypothetical protein